MFAKELNDKILKKKTPLCLGLDPRLEWLPCQIINFYKKKYGSTFKAASLTIAEFNRQVIETVAPYIPVVKLQIAFYEQYGPFGLSAFLKTINFAKKKGLLVIADVKRNDIASTAAAYANSFLGKTDVFGKLLSCYDVDCITINPFLGEDSLLPFIEICQKYGKGVFILVKTSNPGSGFIQDIKINEQSISEKIAYTVNKYAQKLKAKNYSYSNIGAVVGATFPKEARKLRKIMPNSIFLVPGYGTQGGKLKDLKYFFNQDKPSESEGKLGAIINSSRKIVFSYRQKPNGEENYLSIIKQETIKTIEEINRVFLSV